MRGCTRFNSFLSRWETSLAMQCVVLFTRVAGEAEVSYRAIVKIGFLYLKCAPYSNEQLLIENLARRAYSTFSSIYFRVTVPSNTCSNPRNMSSLQVCRQRGNCLHLNDRMSCRATDRRAAAAALSPPAPKPCCGPTFHTELFAARRVKQID
jgi:hypothetical protein